MAKRRTSGTDAGDAPLWISQSARFGVVRNVVFAGPYAAQFDDVNGDFREVCMTVFRRDGSEWVELFSNDDSGYPDADGYGSSNGYAWAVGRDLPGVEIRVTMHDEAYTVQGDAEGWWLLVRAADPTNDWLG